MKHLLAIEDLSPEEVLGILDLAQKVKANPTDYATVFAARAPGRFLGLTFRAGKMQQSLVHVYYKTSTRTKGSFDSAMTQLGGTSLPLDSSTTNFQVGSVKDDIRSLSGFYNAIAARVYGHEVISEMAQASLVPVINALSEREHPCQGLADLLTIREQFGTLEGITLAYVGDGNNVCNSLIAGAYKTGMNIRVATPDIEKYKPAADIMRNAGNALVWTSDPKEAVKGAQVVYTDTWTSLGQEAEQKEREKIFGSYQVNATLLPADALFMHCLPAHRGLEVTADVIDGPRSITGLQSDNRMHAQKAILLKLLLPSLYQ